MKYVTPEMEIIGLDVNDIVCESDGMGEGGDGNIDSSGGDVIAPESPWD